MSGRAGGYRSAVDAAAEMSTSLVPHDHLPWAEIGPGVELKMLRRGDADGVYTMLNRFEPGFIAPKHLHLGDVHAYTIQGRWHYQEYDWVAGPGDYVFEPSGSIHTLVINEDNTEPTIALFTIAKGIEVYDDNGGLLMLQDGPGMDALYRVGLEAAGLSYPEAVLP
ncbi:MAG: 2,4'-dihydroxyacetophenone dioxygenase family protein [Deltaproteobacteria bacterium]